MSSIDPTATYRLATYEEIQADLGEIVVAESCFGHIKAIAAAGFADVNAARIVMEELREQDIREHRAGQRTLQVVRIVVERQEPPATKTRQITKAVELTFDAIRALPCATYTGPIGGPAGAQYADLTRLMLADGFEVLEHDEARTLASLELAAGDDVVIYSRGRYRAARVVKTGRTNVQVAYVTPTSQAEAVERATAYAGMSDENVLRQARSIFSASAGWTDAEKREERIASYVADWTTRAANAKAHGWAAEVTVTTKSVKAEDVVGRKIAGDVRDAAIEQVAGELETPAMAEAVRKVADLTAGGSCPFCAPDELCAEHVAPAGELEGLAAELRSLAIHVSTSQVVYPSVVQEQAEGFSRRANELGYPSVADAIDVAKGLKVWERMALHLRRAADLADELSSPRPDAQSTEIDDATKLKAKTTRIVDDLTRGGTVEALELVRHLEARNENGYTGALEPFELRPILAAIRRRLLAEELDREPHFDAMSQEGRVFDEVVFDGQSQRNGRYLGRRPGTGDVAVVLFDGDTEPTELSHADIRALYR